MQLAAVSDAHLADQPANFQRHSWSPRGGVAISSANTI
jgi:hypothetical protein